MYTERLDVAIEEVDAVLRVAKKCKMHAVVKAIGEEMRTLKYYFKSTRRDEAPRRSELLPLSAPTLASASRTVMLTEHASGWGHTCLRIWLPQPTSSRLAGQMAVEQP